MENEVEEVVEVANDTTDTDYKALYEEEKKEANRLNTIIQKHKKTKVDKVDTKAESIWEWDINKILDSREFYKNNPALSEHKEAIDTFTSNGLTHEQAKTLVLQANPDVANRQATQNSNFTAWTPDFSSDTYSMEQLAEIGKKTPAKYTELMRDYKAGKIKVI